MGTTSNSWILRAYESERSREQNLLLSAAQLSVTPFETTGKGAPYLGFSALRLSLFSSEKRGEDGEEESERVFFPFSLGRPTTILSPSLALAVHFSSFSHTRKKCIRVLPQAIAEVAYFRELSSRTTIVHYNMYNKIANAMKRGESDISKDIQSL